MVEILLSHVILQEMALLDTGARRLLLYKSVFRVFEVY